MFFRLCEVVSYRAYRSFLCTDTAQPYIKGKNFKHIIVLLSRKKVTISQFKIDFEVRAILLWIAIVSAKYSIRRVRFNIRGSYLGNAGIIIYTTL